MLRIDGARLGRNLSVSVMAVAMLAGVGLPRASAAPGDPVTPVNHLLVDAPEASVTIASPGGTASLTTNMETVLVNPKVDIVFVLDTTQSMQPRINQLAQGLSQFVQNVVLRRAG